MKNLQYSRITPDVLPNAWSKIVPCVISALRGTVTTDAAHVFAQIMVQQKALWICHNIDDPDVVHNIVITEFVNYDTGLFLCIFGCATFDDKQLDLDFLYEFFLGYAKSANCIGYEIVGRIGWKYKLPELNVEGVAMRAMFNK